LRASVAQKSVACICQNSPFFCTHPFENHPCAHPCPKHSWRASVFGVTNGSECPFSLRFTVVFYNRRKLVQAISVFFGPIDRISIPWPATHCDRTAKHCTRTATHCKRAATHSNTLQHTAHCNALQHNATQCSALQRTAAHCNTPQRTAAHCNALQRTATHRNALQLSFSLSIYLSLTSPPLSLSPSPSHPLPLSLQSAYIHDSHTTKKGKKKGLAADLFYDYWLRTEGWGGKERERDSQFCCKAVSFHKYQNILISSLTIHTIMSHGTQSLHIYHRIMAHMCHASFTRVPWLIS